MTTDSADASEGFSKDLLSLGELSSSELKSLLDLADDSENRKRTAKVRSPSAWNFPGALV